MLLTKHTTLLWLCKLAPQSVSRMGRSGKASSAGKATPSANSVESVLAAAHGVIDSVPYAPKAGMHPATFISQDADGFASARVLVRCH